jgi:hypothetical protein
MSKAECRNAECCTAECRNAEWCYGEHYAECPFAEGYADCFIQNASKLSVVGFFSGVKKLECLSRGNTFEVSKHLQVK